MISPSAGLLTLSWVPVTFTTIWRIERPGCHWATICEDPSTFTQNLWKINVINVKQTYENGHYSFLSGESHRIINKKLMGTLSVFIYFYLVYVNQDSLLAALIKPLESI